jgi:hypothetical protein
MKKLATLAAGALVLLALTPGTASAGWRHGGYGWGWGGGPGFGVYIGPRYGYYGDNFYRPYPYSYYGYPYAYYPYWRRGHYGRHYGWY